MRLLPVLDLLNGVVVRGVAGQRESYRPVESRIVNSSDPLQVANAIRDQFGLETFYLADLDAILHYRPNLEIFRRLVREGFTLLVDAGIRDLASAEAVLQTGADSLIAGLESTPVPDLLCEFIAHFGAQRVIFSLDLKNGKPFITSSAWGGLPAESDNTIYILKKSLECGVRRLIVLDLAQVGIGQGITTLSLCQEIRQRFSDRPELVLEIITGGGVRDYRDLELLAQSNVDGALIASALHNGQLSRSDVQRIQGIG